jgi:CHASE1-domain containing sensor protein
MARLRRIPFSLSSLKIPVIGLAASLSLALVIAYWETQAASREFDAVADNHRQVLDAGFHKYEDKIVALRALFDATNHPISRREFEVFANELVADAGAIEAFSWIPRVERDDRAAFELGAAKDGFVGYRITALNPHGKPVTSGERDEYFPVLYSTEVSREAPIYGLDLGSDPMRRQTLQRARDTDSFPPLPSSHLRPALPAGTGFSSCCRSSNTGSRTKQLKTGGAILPGSSWAFFNSAP